MKLSRLSYPRSPPSCNWATISHLAMNFFYIRPTIGRERGRETEREKEREREREREWVDRES